MLGSPLRSLVPTTVPSLGPNPASPSGKLWVPSQPPSGSFPPPSPPTAGTSTRLGVAAVGEVTHEGTVGQDLPGRAGDAQHGDGLQQDPVEVGARPQELAEHGSLQGQRGCHPARPGPSLPPRTPGFSTCPAPQAACLQGTEPGGAGGLPSLERGKATLRLSEGRGWRAAAAGRRCGCERRAASSLS